MTPHFESACHRSVSRTQKWLEARLLWNDRFVENLNRNYYHNLFSCFSSFFFLKKRIHIKYRKSNKKQLTKITNLNNTGIIRRSLLFTATLFIYYFFQELHCVASCVFEWNKDFFLSLCGHIQGLFLIQGKKGVFLFSLILLHTCLDEPKMYLCVWVSCSSCTVHELTCHMNAIVVFTSARNAWCCGVETNCLGLFQKAV